MCNTTNTSNAHYDRLALSPSSPALSLAALSPFPSPSWLSSLDQFGHPAPGTSKTRHSAFTAPNLKHHSTSALPLGPHLLTLLPEGFLRLVSLQQLFPLSCLSLRLLLPLSQPGFAAGQPLQDPHEDGHQRLHHTFTVGLDDGLWSGAKQRSWTRLRKACSVVVVVVLFFCLKRNWKGAGVTCSSEYSFPASSLTMLGSSSASPVPQSTRSVYSIRKGFSA